MELAHLRADSREDELVCVAVDRDKTDLPSDLSSITATGSIFVCQKLPAAFAIHVVVAQKRRNMIAASAAVKLESVHPGRTRYLVVVSCTGRQDAEESCLLGIDCHARATVGLVLRVLADTAITLDGDGGFSVSVCNSQHIFKPVSVQAMWLPLSFLHFHLCVTLTQKSRAAFWSRNTRQRILIDAHNLINPDFEDKELGLGSFDLSPGNGSSAEHPWLGTHAPRSGAPGGPIKLRPGQDPLSFPREVILHSPVSGALPSHATDGTGPFSAQRLLILELDVWLLSLSAVVPTNTGYSEVPFCTGYFFYFKPRGTPWTKYHGFPLGASVVRRESDSAEFGYKEFDESVVFEKKEIVGRGEREREREGINRNNQSWPRGSSRPGFISSRANPTTLQPIGTSLKRGSGLFGLFSRDGPMTLTRITYKAGHQPERKHGDAWFRLRGGSLCLAADPVGLWKSPQEQAPRWRHESCQREKIVWIIIGLIVTVFGYVCGDSLQEECFGRNWKYTRASSLLMIVVSYANAPNACERVDTMRNPSLTFRQPKPGAAGWLINPETALSNRYGRG
ncbi:Protein phosphatase Slingshot like protein 1 [Eufriesea mexicana]|uniref:Protein phosphatase Slingshot like protein 1 n=1 Tax=Eufriesea mexicana TaxID=516756 RepID=A0A310SQR7_9HYME|nr:Protein phosphatase Slingshot like protein 1 [Eufriesea mexicana]